MTSVTNSDVQTSRDYASPPERMMKLNTNPSVCKLGPASEASVYNSMENVAYPQIGFQVPKPRFIAKAVSTVEAVDNFSAPLGNLQVRPKQQTNIFAEDFRRTYTKEISYTKDGPNIRLPSEREVSVSTASQVRERSRSPGVDTRMAGSNLGDPTIDWLLQKYKNLEIEYDNDSMETSEPFADLPPSSKSNRNPAYDRSISDLNFPENVGNNSYYDEEGRCEFSDLPTAAYNDSVEFSGGADSSYLQDNSQGVARRDIPTGRVSFGDDVINISRIESVTSKQRLSISPVTDQNTTPFSLPPSGLSGSLIEIRGAGRKTSDVTIGNQDLTTVTSIQTPISQKETSSLNNTASGIGLNCDQTNPFTPETGTNLSSQASPQDHSTPHSGLEQKLDEILDTSRFSNASSKTTSSFTVVDGNEMEIVEVDFSKYASNKEQNQNMSLREERIMSPISSSGGSSKISITPESNLIQIEKQVKSNAHVTPAADISGIVPSSSGGTRSAGTMSQVQGSGSSSSMVSMSPESQLDKTLTSDQEKTPGLGNLTSNTPIVTSALAERKMNYPSQQFEPMPSIDLIDFDSTMTTSPDKAVINEDNNESNKSDDKMESGRFSISGISVGLGDHTLSPEGNSKCSNRSADTLEEQSGERLETIAPSGQSKSLDQFTNSSPETLDGDSPETNASSVSTLAVKGASEGVLESVVTFYPGKERHNLVERANLELSAINESNDTTQSSLGLMDVHAVNASLSETRMSHETSQETEAFNLIQLTQKWADQLKQYKIQTTDLDPVSNSETEEISRQIRSEPSQPMRREESGGGDSVFNRTNDSRKSDQQADVSLAEESNVFSVEQPRKGSGSCGNEEKNQVANMSDCDVSGFSLLKDRESVITATPSVDNSLKSDKLLNDSLLSFRRHEEELLRTDITQDDLVLSFNSSGVRRSVEAEASLRRSREMPILTRDMADGLENAEVKDLGGEKLDVVFAGEDEEREVPTLQELFNARMKKFMTTSKMRQEQVKNNPAANATSLTPKQVIKQRWSANVNNGRKSAPPPTRTSPPADKQQQKDKKELKTKQDRKADEDSNKQRTKNLYNQLEEVKKADEAKRRKELAVQNRIKAQQFSKKISKKNQNNVSSPS
ncbi:centrosomal protein of 295 kDa-like [Symsagittifera roscoffensis]|uniref:centrosomal protein of 295 kDa-like n=1 Tax=Symsagittifera roscoffensis TaxID=84072 RepID=UPI00307B2ED8